MPRPSPIGRPRTTGLRGVVDALLYVAATGCQWRRLPKDFPPYSTVQGYFYLWAQDGTLARINTSSPTRSRHLVGLLIHPADIQDRDGAAMVLATIRTVQPWLRHIFADGSYAGEKLHTALAGLGRWTVEIIKRSSTAKGLERPPRC
jgi:transposase